MKKTILAVSSLAAVALLAGCAAPNTFGSFVGDTTLAHTATSNTLAKGSKKGEAKVTNIIGISSGNVGIKAAAEAGNITKVSAVDIHGKNILGLYAETTTIVYGE